ncbi:hypothetical protein JW948_10280 [bacterium]|nr:hypothetical protein [bacterium]
MIIKPNLKRIRYFVGFVTILGCFFILTGLLAGQILIIIAGILAVLYFPAVKWRMRIMIQDDSMTYVGLLQRFTLKWEEIRELVPMHRYGYPANRIYGPLVYELRTEKGCKKIDFLYFAGPGFREIERRIHNKPS